MVVWLQSGEKEEPSEPRDRLRMKSFSQRKGFKPGAEVIQTDSMNSELRNSLWNVLDIKVWSYGRFEIYAFSEILWFRFFKKPIDSRPDQPRLILKEIRDRFFSFAWYEVYDFLEFVVGGYQKSKPQLVKLLNATLERELSGYRFVSGRLTDITNPQRARNARNGSYGLPVRWR